MSDIPKPIAEMVDADETLIWHGQPRADFALTTREWFLAPALAAMTLTVVGLASAICSVAQIAESGRLLVALFVLTPVLSLAVFVLLDQLKRRNTHFFVTSKRVAIKFNSPLDKTSRSVSYSSNFGMTPIDGPKGTTHLYFGEMSQLRDFMYPPNYPLIGMYHPPTFMFLDDAVRVMDIIIEAKNAVAAEIIA